MIARRCSQLERAFRAQHHPYRWRVAVGLAGTVLIVAWAALHL